MSDQLIGFINNEVVNPKGEFFYNGKLNKPVPPSSSLWHFNVLIIMTKH
jgi:hypothetical protein